MKKTKRSAILCLALAAMTLTTFGCTSLSSKGSFSSKMPWSKKDKKPEPYPNPARMAATWTPDTLVQTDRTPTRGFGGRLFFYDDKTKAVPVEGELTVHAFAETIDGSQGEVKRYQFTAEQFTEHFSQTDIGASYSVWIPWDAVGGDQTRVSLVPSFKAKSGRMIQGEQALVGLPGKRNNEEKIAARPTAANILEASRGDGQSGLVTTTIPVRSGLVRERSASSLPERQPLSAEAIAKDAKPKLQSFDVAPLGINPSQGVNVASAQSTTTPIDTPKTAKPLRLGQGSPLGNRDVMRASATLPLK